MKLDSDFYKLPFSFDVERLVAEVAAIPESLWRKHPSGFKGNSALILVSADAGQNDALIGPMMPTASLLSSPYLQQVLATFKSVIGRTRLMRLDCGSAVSEHSDINYHWFTHVRIHVPIVTDPRVKFICNGNAVHMQAGEAWIFDTWKMHQVHNPSDCTRIHLVMDTCGSAEFWQMLKSAERPFDSDSQPITPIRIPFQKNVKPTLYYEKFNAPLVMAPGEVDALVIDIVDDLKASRDVDENAAAVFCSVADNFRHNWRSVWSLHGQSQSGWPIYRQLKEHTRALLTSIKEPLALSSNSADAIQVFSDRILTPCLNPQLAALHASGEPMSGQGNRSPQHITSFNS